MDIFSSSNSFKLIGSCQHPNTKIEENNLESKISESDEQKYQRMDWLKMKPNQKRDNITYQCTCWRDLLPTRQCQQHSCQEESRRSSNGRFCNASAKMLIFLSLLLPKRTSRVQANLLLFSYTWSNTLPSPSDLRSFHVYESRSFLEETL